MGQCSSAAAVTGLLVCCASLLLTAVFCPTGPSAVKKSLTPEVSLWLRAPNTQFLPWKWGRGGSRKARGSTAVRAAFGFPHCAGAEPSCQQSSPVLRLEPAK